LLDADVTADAKRRMRQDAHSTFWDLLIW